VAPAGPAAAPTSAALDWLRSGLVAPTAALTLGRVERGDPRAAWLARPASGEPELLVPLGSRRAAAATSRRHWDGMSVGARVRQWAGEASLRTGVVQRWWPARVGAVAGADDFDDPERFLVARLAAELGHARLLAAVTARPGQYNAKPVLALFAPDGRPVAFAKVAVDDVSERYVRTEHEWLTRAASAPAPLRAPRVEALLSWQGRPVLVIEPLALPRLPRRRPGWARHRLVESVLALGPVAEVAVADAPGLTRARNEAMAGGDDELAAAVALVVDRLGARRVTVGPWHGDLSPWNTASRRHEVLVWDWELAADGLPLGSDLRHEAVMVATHLRGDSASTALAAEDPTSPEAALYLLEVARRDRDARRAGRVDHGHELGPAALARLTAGLRTVP